MSSFVDELTEYVASLRSQDCPLFPEPLHWAILSNGDAEYQDSIILFGFEIGKDRPSLVAKTPRLPENSPVLQVEYDRLIELWGLLGPLAPARLPKPFALVNIQQRSTLLISYVEGQSLTRTSKKEPWQNLQQVRDLAVDAARSFREILDMTSTPLDAGEQVLTDFPMKAEKFRETYQLSEAENLAVKEILRQMETDRIKASHKVLIQGDFWHGNIIREASQGALMFIDWQYSRWATDVSLDVYLFLLAGALATVLQDSVEARAREIVCTLKKWRPEIIPAYLAAFGKPVGFSLLPVKYGMLACCLEMAVRVGMGFGYNHVNDPLWRMIFCELIDWPEENN